MRLAHAAGVVLVCALAALFGAFARLIVQYVLFSEQLLRLRWTGALVVPEALHAPGWLGVRFGADAPGDALLLLVALLGLVAQLGCLGLALRVYRFATRRHASGETREHGRVVALGCLALAAGVLVLAASLAPSLWGIERAYWLVRVTAAEHQPDLTLARKESMLHDALRSAFHVLVIAAGSLALQLVLQLATWVFAALAIARERGSRLARVLQREGRAAEAEAWRRMPAPPLRSVACVAAVFGLGCLLPAVAGALVHSARLRAAVDAGPGRHARQIFSELERARALLEAAAAASGWAAALAAALALALLVVLPERARTRLATPAMDPPRGSLATLAAALGLAASAALLLHMAAPYAAENRSPLAADPQGVVALPRDSRAGSVVGPDRVELAPVLELTPGHARLDDRAINLAALPGELRLLERRWGELHPGRAFTGRLSLSCGVGTPLREVTPLLLAAARARYTHLQLVFGRWVVVNRPVLGWVREPRFSAARAQLVQPQLQGVAARPAPASSTVRIDLAAMASCDTLNTELVAHRRAGRTVWLNAFTSPTLRP